MTATRITIENILQWASKETGFDVMQIADMVRDNKYSFSGSLSRHELNSVLTNAVKEYINAEYDASAEYLGKFIRSYIEYARCTDTAKDLDRYIDLLVSSREHLKVCEDIEAKTAENIRKELEEAGFPIKTEQNIHATDLLKIKRSIGGRHLHLYQYSNIGSLPKTSKFNIARVVIASNNIEDLITKNDKEDEWNITIGMFIEKKIDLSYFVITFSLKGNVFILTDRFIYQNPDQIDRLRGGGRRFSEDRERALDFFPYVLIDKIIEKRKKSTDITKNSSSELYIFETDHFIYPELFYFVKYTIENIYSGEQVQCVIGADYKAIGDGKCDIANDSSFLQTNMQSLNSLVKELYEEDVTSIAATGSQLIESCGISTQLMTLAEYKSNIQYLAHKQIVQEHERRKYNNNAKDKWLEYSKQKDELLNIFSTKAKSLIPYLFAGDTVHIHDIDHPIEYGGFASSKYHRYTDSFIMTGECNSVYFIRTVRYQGRLTCLSGDGYMVKDGNYRVVSFKRYTEMFTLLGINRRDLPSMFRDYLAHTYMPYTGNSILDNIKPEFTAICNDFVSLNKPNGLQISFPFCGYCLRKLKKIHSIAEEAVIVISSAQSKILEVLPKEEFVSKYIQ